jgi:hypothetical protein
MARPLRGLANRFALKNQAVLNSDKAKNGLFLRETKFLDIKVLKLWQQ